MTLSVPIVIKSGSVHVTVDQHYEYVQKELGRCLRELGTTIKEASKAGHLKRKIYPGNREEYCYKYCKGDNTIDIILVEATFVAMSEGVCRTI